MDNKCHVNDRHFEKVIFFYFHKKMYTRGNDCKKKRLKMEEFAVNEIFMKLILVTFSLESKTNEAKHFKCASNTNNTLIRTLRTYQANMNTCVYYHI